MRYLFAIVVICLLSSAGAFVGLPGLPPSRRPGSLRLNLDASTRELPGSNEESGLFSRRGAFRASAKVAAASILTLESNAACADGATQVKTRAPSIVSKTLCDPSVSTWVKSERLIHILGTAHISSASAELAGNMVREIKPNVVFVELDAKRVSRAGVNNIDSNNVDSRGAVSKTDLSSSGAGVPSSSATSNIIGNGQSSPVAAGTTRGMVTSTPREIPSGQKNTNPFDVQSRLENVGAQYVGNAVKGMYGKLESEGFKAGDEFAASVREGLAIGSTIVLGDRDVEVTLKRLTRALTRTDIRKLLSSDSEVEKSMEELLPQNMRDQLKQQSLPGANGEGAGSMTVTSIGTEDVAINKQEFTTFVETMKTKENVKKIMGALKSMAPEIYEAMVAERDIYMARGLDELDVNISGNVDETVAVVGMAHVEGIETYLDDKGWQQLTYPCPVVR